MDRRHFLSLAVGCAAWPSTARAVARPPKLRRLRLANANTGETFEGTYRNDNGPIDRVMEELCVFLRDHHCGEQTQMDVGVIDFLADVLDAVGETSATILSAYRTAETNAMLARTTFGVAEHSQHILGRALDLRVGSKIAVAMNAARAMQRGGVGWYPHSGFIHIDTGPVRTWTLFSHLVAWRKICEIRDLRTTVTAAEGCGRETAGKADRRGMSHCDYVD